MAIPKEQVITTAGALLAVGGGIAVQRGWISAAGLSILSGEIPNAVDAIYAVIAVVATIMPVVYAVVSNFKSTRIASVAALPNVQAVVLKSQAEADNAPHKDDASVIGPANLAAIVAQPAAQ